MDPRPAEKLEARPARDTPIAWRSSFVRRRTPELLQIAWGTVDAAQLLARHIVPARTIAVVRRITAQPFKRTLDEENNGEIVTYDPTPDFWYNSSIVGAKFDWGWNVGRCGISARTTSIFPGAIVQAPLGRVRDILQGLFRFDYCDGWQRLSDAGGLAQHAPATRYIVEGPAVISLWATVTLDGWLPVPEPPPKLPFCPLSGSFGSLEGIDIPVDRWLDNPAQWLIP